MTNFLKGVKPYTPPKPADDAQAEAPAKKPEQKAPASKAKAKTGSKGRKK